MALRCKKYYRIGPSFVVLHVLPYCVSFEDTHGHSHAHKEKGEKVFKRRGGGEKLQKGGCVRAPKFDPRNDFFAKVSGLLWLG